MTKFLADNAYGGDPSWLIAVGLAILAVYALIAGLLKRVAVAPWQRALVVFGGELRELSPGRHWVRRNADVTMVDIRERTMHVPGQEVQTSDGVCARYGLVARFAVTNPQKYLTTAASSQADLYREFQLALRDIVQTMTVEQAMTGVAEVSTAIQAKCNDRAAALGCSLVEVRILDIQLPPEMRRAVAAVEIERRTAQLHLEKARNEIATLRALANAAKMLQENDKLEVLRRLQVLETALGSAKGNVNISFGAKSD